MTKQSLRQIHPGRREIPIMIIGSTLLLILGLNLPLMNVEKMIFWKNEYSVITGIIGLFKDHEFFLAIILFLFSLVFPIAKLGALGALWVVPFEERTRLIIFEWLHVLGKWSMVDVFVVAILIVAVKLGPLANVTPRPGVYVFCVAIIASIATSQWVERVMARELGGQSLKARCPGAIKSENE